MIRRRPVNERWKRYFTFVHVSRFLLSFVLAFALWAWVTNQRNPEETYLARSVPVTAVGLSSEFAVTFSAQTVDVTLRGPRSVIEDVDTASISVSVDLSNVDRTGTVRRDVDIVAPDGIRRAESSPETIDVYVQAVTEREFEVVVELPEDLPRNLRVTNTRANPGAVVASGVEAQIDSIVQVVAQPQIRGETASFTTQATLVAVDAQNAPIDGITFSPSTVDVDLQLEIRGKEIPVFVRCDACDAAEGFEVIGQPQATPSSVLVDGPVELLDQVQYIYTTPITTNNLTAPAVLGGVPLDVGNLPEGVTVEPVTVDVSVRVEQAVFSQTFTNVAVDILNAPTDLRVTVNPVAIEVIILGRSADLARVQQDDIVVVVDVSGLAPGAHQVTPRVILPPRVTYEDNLPEILVQVSELPSPTPTVQPTATETPVPPTPAPDAVETPAGP